MTLIQSESKIKPENMLKSYQLFSNTREIKIISLNINNYSNIYLTRASEIIFSEINFIGLISYQYINSDLYQKQTTTEQSP